MKLDIEIATVVTVVFVLVGCPTRPNPLLTDADSTTDADADTDGDADADTDADPDESDTDNPCTQPGQVFCEGFGCVQLNTRDHCGACDVECQNVGSCHCDQYGETYRCWSESGLGPCALE